MLRASLANAAHTPHCVSVVAEVAKRGFGEKKKNANFVIFFGRHSLKGHLHKARQQKRLNEFVVVNKMSGLNLDLFCNGYFVSSVSILLPEAVLKPVSANCANISLVYAKLCRAST